MNKQKGFTLIELLVVIAIIGILASVVLAALGSAKGKGNDAKVQSQLKSMTAQAQLYSGSATAVPATAVTVPITAATNLFADSTASTNSLYKLINSLPSGTMVYYRASGPTPLSGGFWAIAASTSVGSFCVDYTGGVKNDTSGALTTTAQLIAKWPNIVTIYTCN